MQHDLTKTEPSLLFKRGTHTKTKGLAEYLQDDADLSRKITHQEYQKKETAPDNNDYPIEEAYNE